MTVIYADSVFLLNGLMDYLVLAAVSWLAGLSLHRGRLAAAALFGGIYAVSAFFPGMGFMASLPVKLMAGVIMTLIAFGNEQYLFRLLLLTFLVACGFAGAVLAVGLLAGGVPMTGGVFYTEASPRVLLIASTAAYLALTVIFRMCAYHGARGELIPVTVCLQNKTRKLTALWDSGNSLRDPITAQPVLIVEAGAILDILPKKIQTILKTKGLEEPTELMELMNHTAPELCPRLLPYHGVGIKNGLLTEIRADWIEVSGTRFQAAAIGLSPTELGPGYKALWGGENKGGQHEVFETFLGKTSKQSGFTPAGKYSLHRRKRYSADSTGEMPGGGIAETSGR